jgi:tetratricopeptide (TPR) repeat protein
MVRMNIFRTLGIVTSAMVLSISHQTAAQSEVVVNGQKGRTSWNEAKSNHVTVYGQMSPAAIQKYTEDLERYDAALREIIGGTTTVPLTVYVVSSMSKVEELADASGVAGFYDANAERAYAVTSQDSVIRSDFKFTSKQVLFHEYAHHILLASANETRPRWVSEGMAEFFGTATIGRDGSITVGAPPLVRGFTIAGAGRWSAAELLESDNKKLDALQTDQLYSRGWLMVHYLLLNSERKGQFANFLNLLNSGIKPLEAGKQAFGDLKKLDTETDRYLHRSTFPGFTIMPKTTKDGIMVTVRNLSIGEAEMMANQIVSTIGPKPEPAKVLVRASRSIAAKYPDNLSVQNTLTKMEYDARNWNEAEAAVDRTLALQPNNVLALVYKGRVLGQRALLSKDQASWKIARSFLLKANKINPDYALPFVLYYDSFLAAGVKPNESAVNGLLRSIVLVPQYEGLHIRIAVLRMAENDLVGARKIFAGLAANPHADSAKSAKKILEKFDQNTNIADIMTLIKDEQLDIVNEFTPPEAFKKDSKKKGD